MSWFRFYSVVFNKSRLNENYLKKRFSFVGLSLATLSLATAISSLAVGLLPSGHSQMAIASEGCPAALESFRRHTTTDSETLTSIAANYGLFPETLARFNPDVADSTSTALSAGTELIVPPFNGRVMTVAQGESWPSLAERYGSRPDVLFEVNGCVSEVPDRIFIPGAMPIAPTASGPSSRQLDGYPLSQTADIALSYGWQPHPSKDELVFYSGLTFSVPTPMDVQSVGAGTVAFVGDREGYGQLLVINHEQGLQTRYANLSDISVSVGQSVSESMVVGAVGASTEESEETASTFLYFEVRTNSASGWVAQDPGKYLPALELR